jgi:WD40 repeat protein
MHKTAVTLFRCVLLVLFATNAYPEGQLLKFYKKIGIGGAARWSGWMSFVAFSSDGSMVASDGPQTPDDSTGSLTLWSFPDGQLIRSLPPRPWAISDDWRYYASEKGIIDMQSGTLVPGFENNGNGRVVSAFSRDGRYVAVANGSKTEGSVRVIRVADGSLLSEFGRRAVFALAFNPQGNILASGHWDNVTLWNVETGERIALLRGFDRYVYGISFSQDGTLLATGTVIQRSTSWEAASQHK